MTPVVKKPPANVGDIRGAGSIPGSGRSPGGGHGHPLQYSCGGKPIDRTTGWAIVHWVAKSQTGLKQLSKHVVSFNICKLSPLPWSTKTTSARLRGERKRPNSPFRYVLLFLAQLPGHVLGPAEAPSLPPF